MRTVTASGLDALRLTTELLHRVRLADPDTGVWEAADVQWWWRTPRGSDVLEQRFVCDDDGPIAAAIATEWNASWGIDPIAVPGVSGSYIADVFHETVEVVRAFTGDERSRRLETLVRDDDEATIELVRSAGFEATDDRGGITWLAAADRSPVPPVPPGFAVADRAAGDRPPHPMAKRNGPDVDARLRQVSLYQPSLDLSMTTDAGETVAYALFWFDPVTRVGLVEPMRVEDAWQRRGFGRILLATGIDRMVQKGATRIKVGWASPPGRGLYLGSGFKETSTDTTYARAIDR